MFYDNSIIMKAPVEQSSANTYEFIFIFAELIK